jgi:hypothetical protein
MLGFTKLLLLWRVIPHGGVWMLALQFFCSVENSLTKHKTLTLMNTNPSIILLALAAATLSSCVVSDYPGGPVRGSVSSTFGVYNEIPDSYVGDAYRYNNRYYYGGNYERGNYTYKGRQYTNRYNHGGTYYYGGSNQHYGTRAQQNARDNDTRNHDRNQQFPNRHRTSSDYRDRR